MYELRVWVCGNLLLLSISSVARADTKSVGPGKPYGTPCAAFAAAADGDTVEIDASGSYGGDVCTIAKNNLTIRGVNGRAHIDAAGQNASGKAIWVAQGHDTLIEDIELSGCHVPDGNGAGIRQEGRNLTLRRCYLHDNENGLLGDPDAQSTYLFEDCEFARNGAGDGQTHNMYIGEIASFTLRGSYSHDAKVGHLVKSRALRNHILYNRLSDEAGNASYELDLPQGGQSFVIGNLIEKSPNAQNSALVSYARETKRNADSSLWIISNTFVNQRDAGTFVAVASDITSVTLRDNIFAGAGTVCDLAAAQSDHEFTGDPAFVAPASYDYSLSAGSPAIDRGVAPGTASGESLVPVCQYRHPAHAVLRQTLGSAIDQGALEFGNAATQDCASASVDAGEPNVDGGMQTARADGGMSAGDAAVVGAARDAAVSSGDATSVDGSIAGDPRLGSHDSAGCALSRRRHGSHVMLVMLAVLLQRRRRARHLA